MGDGMIDAMVVQDPYHMGYYGVRMLKAMLTSDDADLAKLRTDLPGEKDVFDTPLKVIVPDKGSPLKKEQFPKDVEFHTLGAFKKWLQEFGLTGS
jgi:ribose transport system substrate-binding protein